MISVGIFINGKLIHRVDGINVSEELGKLYGKGKQFYQLSVLNEKIINHEYEGGAIRLAIKMLEELLIEEGD